MERAVNWALENMHQYGVNDPKQHGFVDLVRQYFIDNSIEHEPMSFEDVEPYL